MYLSSSRAADASAGVVRDRPGIRRAVAGTVVALGLVSMVTDVSSEMVTAVLPLYLVAGLGMTPLAYGLLDGVYQGVTALVRLAGSYAADRTHRRKLVAGSGYALSAVCKLGLLAVTTPWAIGAVLAADRTGKGLRSAPRDALISLSTAPEDQGRAFGVHRTLDTAGALLGPLAAFAVLWPARDAYDAVFQVSFCCAVFGVLLLALYVREPRAPRHPAHPPRPGLVRALRTLAGTPGVPRLSLAAVLLGAATLSDAFLYLVLQQRHHLDARWFPLLPVGTAAAFLLLALPVGRLADRVGRLRVFLAGHGALLAAYLLLLVPLGGGAQLPATAALFVLLGVFYAATDGVLMAATAPLLPPALRASGLALVQTGQAVGRFGAAVLFGAAWTALGPATALAGAAGVLAAALALCLPVLVRDRSSAAGKAAV